MKTFDAVLFFNDGFEEAEAITPLDVLRRGGCEAVTVSLTGKKEVTGAHGVTVLADALYDEIFPDKPETQGIMMVLPGGPGTSGYKKHAAFLETLRRHHGAGGNFAA
ncbi:MAG: DJ-1/PfpI family protein, partial [Clostridiales bacterium]|nr:DJ-1/PfpI family protein [Clostridiales bacterium]